MERKSILISVLAILLVLALIIIIVSTVDDRPTAKDDNVTTPEDTSVSITLKGSDSDSDLLRFSLITEPSYGSLSGTEPNLTYTPHTNFNGQDSFTFKVNDGKADSSVATISIVVTPVNDPPQAHDDSATMQEDAPIVTINVLTNDTDPDNDRLTVITSTQGSYGSVTINANGTMTYTPNKNFCGTDEFSYTISDGKGATDNATVNVTVNAVNDTPVITSKPETITRVWAKYTYDVDAKEPDVNDKLTYSLTTKPEGMTIDSDTGLIEFRPTSAQVGTYDVVVKVEDSNSTPASDTQSFTITVASLSSPLRDVLTVIDGYNQKSKQRLSAEGKANVVQTSDNNWLQTEFGSYVSYDFLDVSIPPSAKIKSVVVYLEHFEEERFPSSKLQWDIGTGWPGNPRIWASANAPVHGGQQNEATDSWDVTSFVDTSEKVDSLQLRVRNNDNADKRKTFADHIYAVVEWY